MSSQLCIRGVGKAVPPSAVVKGRCPLCGRDATFGNVGASDLLYGIWELGIRRCPNDACLANIFFISSKGSLRATFPAQRVAFETTGIPERIVRTLQEAITCHAEKCFVASAIMIRRTLEEICHEKGAQGQSLKQRIESLRDKVVVPKELFEGMDELRLLGNDAAHIESREYENIGEAEVEVGIDFAKEILKAVYQYENLLGRLKDLRKKDESGPTP